MKNIILKRISLSNFKGIKSLVLNFENISNIFAANGVGKTTIFDAFTWLLFGKDSQDRKDFDIKPLDESGNPIQKIENEVEALLVCNGEEINLKRIQREKWVKKRGFAEPEFTGNETIYFWNEVPLNAKEFNSKISELVDEGLFKLLSNPLAFNNLKWQDRRKVLVDFVGNIEVDYAGNGLSHIVELTRTKNIDELKREATQKIKNTKTELDQIPTRIDEVEKSKPVAPDFASLETVLKEKETQLSAIENQISDSSEKNRAYLQQKTDLQNVIFDLKNRKSTIEWEVSNQATAATKKDTSKLDNLKHQHSTKKFELSSAESYLKQLENNLDAEQKRLTTVSDQMAEMRARWGEINQEQLSFNENDFHCPACKRAFESGDIEQKKADALANFNADKRSRLQWTTEQGQSLKAEVEQIEKTIETQKGSIQKQTEYIGKIKSEIISLQSAIEMEENLANSSDSKTFDQVYSELLVSNQELNSISIVISNKESELNSIVPVSNDELNTQKSQIQSEIKSINDQLGIKIQIAAADNRIQELKQNEKKLAETLLQYERQQFDIEKYIKLGIEALDSSVNSKFKLVKFKLFDTQINGGEVECCDALIDGVPFHSANTASKVNAGIDIINTLAEYYKVTAPIFIDNRESVTNLIESGSQLISLIVSPADKTFRIEA
ncbi:MAG: AAA family ATPase [Flavobacterium nitrogenifigens]|uniref:AAA family ATPase n=1 Tax=Flavobacterium nitrogenifigens TaxID=1617283 RepID=UPI002809DDE0|nr:AAA family ATPase [Flavobacterium nitrogenifigens]MDQ8014872.1 AAA family ATPase [Flavobacterium nitrogenifigens]